MTDNLRTSLVERALEIAEAYFGKKSSKDAKRAAWMAEYERHVTTKNPKMSGKVDWDTAHYFHSQGHSPLVAAQKMNNDDKKED